MSLHILTRSHRLTSRSQSLCGPSLIFSNVYIPPYLTTPSCIGHHSSCHFLLPSWFESLARAVFGTVLCMLTCHDGTRTYNTASRPACAKHSPSSLRSQHPHRHYRLISVVAVSVDKSMAHWLVSMLPSCLISLA